MAHVAHRSRLGGNRGGDASEQLTVKRLTRETHLREHRRVSTRHPMPLSLRGRLLESDTGRLAHAVERLRPPLVGGNAQSIDALRRVSQQTDLLVQRHSGYESLRTLYPNQTLSNTLP